MPQAARGRKMSSTRSRRAGTAGRTGSGTPRKPAKKKKATRASRQTTSRPRRKTATRKKAARSGSGAASRNGRTRGDGAQIKDALLARRAETLDLLERSSDYGKQRLREDAEDLVDQATDSQARDVVYALSSVEEDMIKQIDGALERIDAGDYGKCDNCDEPIQKRRLEAVPWARLCVACQELQEQGILQSD